MKKIIFFGLMIVWQQDFAQEAASIKLLAKAKSNSIWLRWAPSDPTTWYYGNEVGYQIERYTIAIGSKLTDKPIKVVLNNQPLKPKPLDMWRKDVTINRYSAIAAQAIYGKSFQVSMANSNNMTEIVNQAREQEQRFSFALFCADQSFNTAQLSALAWKDSTIKKDERYLYKVYALNPNPKFKIDTGLFYIGLRDSVGLSPPVNLQAKFTDRLVHLRWPRFAVEREYTSFIIERADEKGVFKQINKQPFINTLSKAENHFQALDSLPQNGIEYQYRIRGVTPFGEIGPESEKVIGKGFTVLNATASIRKAREEKEKIVITWEVTGNKNSLRGFYVERSPKVDGKFEAIHKAMLPNDLLKYIDDKPMSTNYYRIKIMGEQGQENFSFPYLAQLADSVPPTPPQGLKVVIDTTGVAKLIWVPNKENDLLGYRIYRSNFAAAEYTQINRDPTPTASYIDSININRLNSKIYYKLVAVDNRFNPSDYSTPVIVELPDVIPPLPPVIESVRSTPIGVRLTWSTSASDDVTGYRLLRKQLNANKWDTVKTFTLEDSLGYTDKNLEPGKEYYYSVVAKDKAQHLSTLSSSVKARVISRNTKPAITDIKADVDGSEKSITLQWKYNEKEVAKFLVYRAAENESLSLYKSVSYNTLVVKDMNLKTNTIYKYRLKVVFKDGTESNLSSLVEVAF
jgi:uncharacterized protein